MNDDTALSRREFLMLSAAAAVSLLIRSRLPEETALRDAQQILLTTRLATLLSHKESAKLIGIEYLQKYRQEAKIRVLIDQIISSSALSDGGLFGASGQNLRELLDHMIRADFEVDRVVKLRGWILSATEARLCALVALL